MIIEEFMIEFNKKFCKNILRMEKIKKIFSKTNIKNFI